MIVSHRHQFAFVSNPKAASTSIEAALSAFDERADLNKVASPGFYTARHMPATEMRQRLGRNEWDRMFTFGVVRHPCDWFVSQLTYNYQRLELEVPYGRRLAENDVKHVHSILADRRGRQASASGSQWAFLCTDSRTPVVSHLVPLERLREEWPALLRRMGVSVPLPGRLNRTSHPEWTTWLDDGARKVVESLWADDLDLHLTALARTALGSGGVE